MRWIGMLTIISWMGFTVSVGIGSIQNNTSSRVIRLPIEFSWRMILLYVNQPCYSGGHGTQLQGNLKRLTCPEPVLLCYLGIHCVTHAENLLIPTWRKTHVHRKTEQDRNKKRCDQPTNPKPKGCGICYKVYARKHDRASSHIESSGATITAVERSSNLEETDQQNADRRNDCNKLS